MFRVMLGSNISHHFRGLALAQKIVGLRRRTRAGLATHIDTLTNMCMSKSSPGNVNDKNTIALAKFGFLLQR
jgi:hypothetical protein